MNNNQAAGLPDFTQCPYWGMGGRYIADPVTGLRTPVSSQPATPNPVPAVAIDNAAQPVEPMKENENA